MKYRLYSIVLRHLSGIQKGIQHGHSKDVYEEFFSKDKDYQQWLSKDKTVIVLQCNSCKEILDIENQLKENNVKCKVFYEEDLGNIPTSISFLVDEKVWNKEKYPDIKYFSELLNQDTKNCEVIANQKAYDDQTGFLKVFLKQFHLAQN